MENFIVKDLGSAEQKSVQEIEQELLDKHEESISEPKEEIVNEVVNEEPVSNDFKDEDVLSYIKNKYGREASSIDDLFSKNESREELPEDVAAYYKYKQETGRGIEDFVKLNRNFDDMDPNELLAEYYLQTEEDLDKEDILYMMEDKFDYDEDLDDPKEIKSKEIAKKKELAKAKKFFDQYKESYKTPIESRGGLVSDDERESYEAYKRYVQDSTSIQEENLKRSQYFMDRTNELLNDDFKGFDFNVGDKTIKFLPNDVAETRRVQSDVNNFISRFLDDKGLIKDAAGYHRALAAAMNPEKMAKFFYEQGRSEALLDNNKRIKNIDMDVRSSPQSIGQSGFKVTASSNDSGRGLKIKSNRK